MPLTDRAIQNLRPTDKKRRHFDGGGLRIFLASTDGKLCGLSIKFEGRGKLLSVAPDLAVNLKITQERRGEAKELLVRGVDHSEHKKEL